MHVHVVVLVMGNVSWALVTVPLVMMDRTVLSVSVIKIFLVPNTFIKHAH